MRERREASRAYVSVDTCWILVGCAEQFISLSSDN